ncbi:hypothetical protein M3Y94_01322900 [Aphelenchoides besseyi]|nr:hypothetical protein M3Y94_01322900 [Aphelenchoides besseyi]KAI6222036.1 Arginine kinase [Aphelenchoides besseyi]
MTDLNMDTKNEDEQVRKVEDAFKILQSHPECSSLLAKNLTKDIVDKLKDKKTTLGATLYDVIRFGVKNLDSGVGVYAPDAESYTTFAPLFDKIIEDFHGFKPWEIQPLDDLGENRLDDFPPLDPEGKYIQFTTIRCGRSIRGYPFNSQIWEEEYKEMKQKVNDVLEKIEDNDLKGRNYKHGDLSLSDQLLLIADQKLFLENDDRGFSTGYPIIQEYNDEIFVNDAKTFLTWINEEDHLRIISMEKGSDVGKVLDRLIRGIKSIESKLPFARDSRLGWLTLSPVNLGSTVRAFVRMKLPKVSAGKDFGNICEHLNLQPCPIQGENVLFEKGVFDISNVARLGKSEVECVKEMYDGVKKLIEMEESAS